MNNLTRRVGYGLKIGDGAERNSWPLRVFFSAYTHYDVRVGSFGYIHLDH